MSLLKKTDLEVSSAICKLIPGNEEISVEKSDWSWRQKWGEEASGLGSHSSENHDHDHGWHVGNGSPVR